MAKHSGPICTGQRQAGAKFISGKGVKTRDNLAAHFAERVQKWNKSYSDLLARHLPELYVNGKMEIYVGFPIGDSYFWLFSVFITGLNVRMP